MLNEEGKQLTIELLCVVFVQVHYMKLVVYLFLDSYF